VKRDNKPPAVVMDYNIAQLLKQQIGAVRDYSFSQDLRGLDPALDPVEPLVARFRVVRTKRGVLVTMTGTTSLRVPCSRCLEPVTVPVSLSIEEEFLQTIDIVTGLPLGTSADDPALLIDGHHELHLAEVVREYLLLAIPMHPLCREDCKGLCPQCGHNLNEGPCGHSGQPGDERWAVLRSLLDT